MINVMSFEERVIFSDSCKCLINFDQSHMIRHVTDRGEAHD